MVGLLLKHRFSEHLYLPSALVLSTFNLYFTIHLTINEVSFPPDNHLSRQPLSRQPSLKTTISLDNHLSRQPLSRQTSVQTTISLDNLYLDKRPSRQLCIQPTLTIHLTAHTTPPLTSSFKPTTQPHQLTSSFKPNTSSSSDSILSLSMSR